MNNLKKLFKSPKRIAIFIAVILLIGFVYTKTIGKSAPKTTYQTAIAEKGTLISSVTASGKVSIGGAVEITTNVSGIAFNVYVKNGDIVTLGQKIAEITLDQASQQKQTAAWASYLSAKNQLDSTQNQTNNLQAAEFKANQTFMLDAVARNLASNDPVYIQENALWLAAEESYKNQVNVIAQSQANLSSAWYNYQQTSSEITAPTSGIVSNLTIAHGLPILSTTSTSNTNSSQALGNIVPVDGKTQATVNLSETDAAKVSAGQKVMITLDAFSGKTFTGKVLIVDTNGQISSGVTTYPTTIIFDSAPSNIYPNMGVNATIITAVKNDVIFVPSAAVQTSNGQSTVRILVNGKITDTTVEIGDSNDTQTEIISGINPGDTVITGVSMPTTSTSGGGSIFGGFGGNRGGIGGGGNIRINRN